jgi:hypothetical protein
MRLLSADIGRERKMHDLYNLKNKEWKKFKVSYKRQLRDEKTKSVMTSISYHPPPVRAI